MEHKDYISTLPETERKVLAVCGISTAEQLSRISPEKLCAEIEQAKLLFGDELPAISKERLAVICRGNGTATPKNQESEQTQKKAADDALFARNIPELKLRNNARHRKIEDTETAGTVRELTQEESEKRKKHIISKSGAIRCTRPLRTMLSALLLLWMYAAIIGAVVYTTGLLLGTVKNASMYIPAGLFLAGVLPYILIVRKTKCSVCNMPALSMVNYPRNKHAHHFPLLGYTVPTALHIIFFWWYRCPACGTPQKLLKSSKHHR
jgi:hypothetical protein